jgi:hypothetical protein
MIDEGDFFREKMGTRSISHTSSLITGTRYALPHYELVRGRKKSENHWLSLGDATLN